MRALLFGALLTGCLAPSAECGWMEQTGFSEGAPGDGTCARIVVEDDSRLVRAPADGCSADSASRCLILGPGETAQAFSVAKASEVFGTLSATRENASLVDGACPLVCD